jgi:hypothetical protein
MAGREALQPDVGVVAANVPARIISECEPNLRELLSTTFGHYFKAGQSGL